MSITRSPSTLLQRLEMKRGLHEFMLAPPGQHELDAALCLCSLNKGIFWVGQSVQPHTQQQPRRRRSSLSGRPIAATREGVRMPRKQPALRTFAQDAAFDHGWMTALRTKRTFTPQHFMLLYSRVSLIQELASSLYGENNFQHRLAPCSCYHDFFRYCCGIRRESDCRACR